jgi:hypothetical protein
VNTKPDPDLTPESVVTARKRQMPGWARLLLVLGLLYLFLVGVKMLEGGIKGVT